MERLIIFKTFSMLFACLFISDVTFGETRNFINDRQAMFDKSKSKMKILRQSIRDRDQEAGLAAITFHLDWSNKLESLFPPGNEASVTNSSDASGSIWSNFEGFKNLNTDYLNKARQVKTAIESEDFVLAKDSFLQLTRTCKTCHEKFRN